MVEPTPHEVRTPGEVQRSFRVGAVSPAESMARDADILLKLVEIRSADRLDDAFDWMRSEFSARDYADFHERYPRGSVGRHKFVAVCNFFELCGVLVKRGLIDEDLFFDISFGLELIWSKVRHIVPGYREHTTPRMWENFEWLHQRSQTWEATHPPMLLQ